MIKDLGPWTSKTGKRYQGQWIPDGSPPMVQAVGPMPVRPGSRGVVFEDTAETEEVARRKLDEAKKTGKLP